MQPSAHWLSHVGESMINKKDTQVQQLTRNMKQFKPIRSKLECIHKKKKKWKSHSRHSADVPWCPNTLCMEDKHVHTFELEKQENIKKDENFCLATVLAMYDSSNS